MTGLGYNTKIFARQGAGRRPPRGWTWPTLHVQGQGGVPVELAGSTLGLHASL